MNTDYHQVEWGPVLEDDLRQLVRLAVREDLDRGCDWTTVALVGIDQRGRADMVARQPGVVAGLPAVAVLCDEMNADIGCELLTADGDRISSGQPLATLSGSARDLLTCERPLLNFLGRLSGIASLTAQFVGAIEGTGARIYDTRKTTPGWRRLEKYAVRCGGGSNHRGGLFDGMLIKDNHLAVASGEKLSLPAAVQRGRTFIEQNAACNGSEPLLLEVEVDSLTQLRQVLPERPDIVLLDNMSSDQLREAVAMRNELAGGVELEASGGVHLESVRDIAQTGVDRISVGALTHSARTLDIGLDWHGGRSSQHQDSGDSPAAE